MADSTLNLLHFLQNVALFQVRAIVVAVLVVAVLAGEGLAAWLAADQKARRGVVRAIHCVKR